VIANMQVKIVSLIIFLLGSHLVASLHTPTDQSLLGHSNPTFDKVKYACVVPILHQLPKLIHTSSLKKASIINEVVDEFTPQCFVAPFYGKKEIPVALGNYIKPKKTQDKPKIKVYCPHLKDTKGMTIVLTDPDAPTRSDAKWGQFCHWIAAVESLGSDGAGEVEIDGDDIVDCKCGFSATSRGIFVDVGCLRQTSVAAREDGAASLCVPASTR
jgi:hypothetical protein